MDEKGEGVSNRSGPNGGELAIRSGLSELASPLILKMLERLQITNFQCHDRLRIGTDPQITAIVGPSDTGKSAIIRALRWLVINRPLGTGFIREGAKQAEVRVRIGGKDVQRIKGPSDNQYRMAEWGDKDSKGYGQWSEYDAVGYEVPEPIQRFLALDATNFQGQHDAPFWFDKTPGELAKELNAIVDLEVIDSTSYNLASLLRQKRAELGVIEERIKKAVADEERLRFVPNVDRDLSQLERLGVVADDSATRHTALATLVDKVLAHQRGADRCRGALVVGRRVCLLGAEVAKAVVPCDRLGVLIKSVKKAQEDIRAVPDLGELGKHLNDAKESWRRWDELTELVDRIENELDLVKEFRSRAKAARTRLVQECGGVCPVCGNPMRGEKT